MVTEEEEEEEQGGASVVWARTPWAWCGRLR